MQLKVTRLQPDAKLPTYGTVGAACFDLYATHDGYVAHGEPLVVDTGLAFEIPEGHVMLVFGRSGMAFGQDTRLANCVGVIDSDYRGEVKVKLTCDDPLGGFILTRGSRIAQAMIVPYPKVEFVEVQDLPKTERGADGFGSTGK